MRRQQRIKETRQLEASGYHPAPSHYIQRATATGPKQNHPQVGMAFAGYGLNME